VTATAAAMRLVADQQPISDSQRALRRPFSFCIRQHGVDDRSRKSNLPAPVRQAHISFMSAKGRQERRPRQTRATPRAWKERFHGPDFPEFRCRRSHRVGIPDDRNISPSQWRPLTTKSACQGPRATASDRPPLLSVRETATKVTISPSCLSASGWTRTPSVILGLVPRICCTSMVRRYLR